VLLDGHNGALKCKTINSRKEIGAYTEIWI